MGKRLSMETRKELLGAVRERYRQARKEDRSVILDEFVELTEYHRKYAIRLLNAEPSRGKDEKRRGRRIYDEAVREALLVAWETADRICGKRLKAALPLLVESMERHGHLDLDDRVREQLLKMSAATIDRLLAPARQKATKNKKRKQAAKAGVRRRVPIRTFGDWNDPLPGFFEADFVAHCGGSLSGSFVHSFMVTDIASGWTDGLPLIVREQTLVTEALNVLRARLPVKMLGLDTDNDGAFINETLIGYCDQEGIEFTRSRAYRKNDQAWIEQKNGAVVRRLVGYGRLEGVKAARALFRLYDVARSYVNFFLPSFKLLEKRREGAKVKKRYLPPATPCDRLLADGRVSQKVKALLEERRELLDPVALLREMRSIQAELAAHQDLAEVGGIEESKDVHEFVTHLSTLWKQGEARPTHRVKPRAPRHWRTHVDAFECVWEEVLGWLETDPDMTAKALLYRLCEKYPGQFTSGQLRTLQRRVRSWRQSVAKALIFSAETFPDPTAELKPTAGQGTRPLSPPRSGEVQTLR